MRIGTLINIAVVCFWLSMSTLLIRREFIPVMPSPSEINFPGKLPFEMTWNVCSNEKKIGYTAVDITAGEKGLYVLNNTTIVEVPDFISKIIIPYLTSPKDNKSEFDPDKILGSKENEILDIGSRMVFGEFGRLDEFDVAIHMKKNPIMIHGKEEKGILKLEQRSPSGKIKWTLTWSANNSVIGGPAIPLFFKTGLKMNDRFRWTAFNPLTGRRENINAKVERQTFYYTGGDFSGVSVTGIYYQNIKFELWIDKDGIPLKIITPWGWELLS